MPPPSNRPGSPYRPLLTNEERAALVERFERRANHPATSPEVREKLLWHAGRMRNVIRHRIDREAERDAARRALYREELSYDRLILMSEMMVGWAQDARMTRELSAKCLALSDDFRQAAEEARLNWSPPEPERLSAISFLGRHILPDESET